MSFDRPEDFYPLSPLQQGMLFHTLEFPASGVCFEQDIFEIRGELDVDRFRSAWERVIARHPILRTSFLWEDIDEPHQIVHRQGALELAVQDWRNVPADERAGKLQQYMLEERQSGFDLTTLPVMRIGLLRLEDDVHQLVWNFHHAILDGWSLPLVIREVLAIYQSELRGTPVRLGSPRPYRDYIAWLQQQDLAKAEAHWRRRLQGFTSPTPLTVDRRSSFDEAVTDETFQRIHRKVPVAATSELTSFARTHHVTLNTLVQGAWALLLSRYSSTEDVVFGCNVSGRSPQLRGVEEMIGLFINTLPLRVSTAAEQQLLPWLAAVQEQVIELREFEYSPLIQVQKWSSIGPGQSLFDSIVVFENYPMVDSADAGRALEVTYQPWTRHSKTGYPLTLLALPGDELLLEIKFDRRRFEVATIERMLGHVEKLLEGIAENPQRRIGEISLLQTTEREELIRGFDRVAVKEAGQTFTSRGTSLHGLFEAQVAQRPDEVALVCNGLSLTYEQLNAQANRLARQLVKYGIKRDTLVGLCLDRTEEMVIAILAILKAGGAYLPIDLAYPAERLTFMLEDSKAPVVLTQSKLKERFPATQAKLLCIDEILAQPKMDGEEVNLSSDARPEDLAYVIYTSGTTGKPKGSLIAHQNVTRLFSATQHWFAFDERDVWTLFHSCAFDFSVWEIWGALLYGGRLVVVPFMVSRSPEAFYELLAKERVTVLNQTPSAFRQLIQAEESVGQKDLALRYVIFGGEALEMQSLRPWFDRHGDQKPKLINMYGITETTVHVTYRPLSQQDLKSGSVIGESIPDLRIYILDPQRQPVPIGVPGEMYVGGAGLARGYLGRPELTAERFIPNHLTGEPQSRLYKTGDLARFLPDHDIEYLGRIDDQVKIRGFRIELGEIESVLNQHPAVRESAVLAREDQPGSKRLVAYLVAASPVPEISALREHLKKQVPDYMVPAAFVFLEKFPLTNNGKVDRKALPVPEQQRPELAGRYVAPRTPAEETLSAIWKKTLRVERVGVNDNFFELGGDSILSIQIISSARREGLQLTPALLFAHQTIAELSAAAGGLKTTTQTLATPGVVAGEVALTPIEKWFFEQQLEDVQHYNQSFLFEVSERMERKALERALAEVQRHHDALRLRFEKRADGWRQSYSATELAVPLAWTDLSQADAAKRTQALEKLAASEQASLNLKDGPLWRAAYFDFGEAQPGRLLLAIHHLAVDGISWRPLLEDLESAYRQIKTGKKVELPAKTSSYKEWAERINKHAESQALRLELPYWKAATDPQNVSAALKPLEINAPAEQNTEGAAKTLKVSLTPEETRALLQNVPAAYNTQINDVLLTALLLAWNKWSGSRVLFTNLEGHGREHLFEDLDLSRTAGWFTSIFPVRLELPDGGETDQPGEILKSVKEQLRKIPQRGIGFGMLRYLASGNELAGAAEPALVFNYLGQFDQILGRSGLFRFAEESTGPWHSPKQKRRQILETNCVVINGRLEIAWTYNQNLHAGKDVGALAAEYTAALKDVIAHCQSDLAGGRTPSDFPLARLEQSAIDSLFEQSRDMEDVYPLSPIQTLFYSANPGKALLSFDQWHCTLGGELQLEAFQRAWHETVRRHSILRSTIHGEELREPVQVVHRDIQLTWTIEDWRASSVEECKKRWIEFLRQDRGKPLMLNEAPVMRFALIRWRDRTWKFLWSVPALLLDGWSWPLVFRDASRLYEAYSKNVAPQLEVARPYRDYVEWLSGQANEEATKFWQEQLAGFRRPTPLPGDLPARDAAGERYLQHVVQLSSEATNALQSAARRTQVTLNTLVQGSWSLLLSRQSGNPDVVFGAAFSGRPADLPGVESIVGPFTNNLPVRVTVNTEAPGGEFFRTVHNHLLKLASYQFTPLMEIQRSSEVPWRYRLFDSLVVFQNYLVDETARRLGEQVEIADFEGPIHTNYPVLLLAEPDAGLRLTLVYDRKTVARSTMERWGHDLQRLLELGPALLDKSVGELQKLLSPRAAQVGQADQAQAAPSQNFMPAQTEMEKSIAAVWQKMFGLEQINVETNFFELGGHSLLLVQMHGLLRQALSSEFPIVALFEHPTVRALARHLGQPAESSNEKSEQLRDRALRQKRALAQMRVPVKK